MCFIHAARGPTGPERGRVMSSPLAPFGAALTSWFFNNHCLREVVAAVFASIVSPSIICDRTSTIASRTRARDATATSHMQPRLWTRRSQRNQLNFFSGVRNVGGVVDGAWGVGGGSAGAGCCRASGVRSSDCVAAWSRGHPRAGLDCAACNVRGLTRPKIGVACGWFSVENPGVVRARTQTPRTAEVDDRAVATQLKAQGAAD